MKAQLVKGQLTKWSPARKSRVIECMNLRKVVRVNIQTPRADFYFEHTHHRITRTDLKAPPPLELDLETLDVYRLNQTTAEEHH